jgi:hypothetical protein
MLSRDIADGGVLLQPPQIGEAGNGFEVGDPGARPILFGGLGMTALFDPAVQLALSARAH